MRRSSRARLACMIDFMRVLAIDTALAACSAAVLDTEYGGIVASESLPMMRGHAEALMPLLQRVMSQAGMAFADHRPHRRDHRARQFYRVAGRHRRRARHCARRRQAGRRPVDAFGSMRRPTWRPTTACRSSPPSMRGTRRFICRSSAPGGRTLTAPRLAPVARSGARGGRRRPPASSARRRKRSPPHCPKTTPSRCGRRARGAGYRLGGADGRRRAGGSVAAEAAISARARRAAAKRRATSAPMMGFVARLFGRAEPAVSEARRARRRRDRRIACGVVPARLGRGGVSPAADRS